MNNGLTVKKYYSFLDGLRAIAIFWILLHHARTFFKWGALLQANALNIPFAHALDRVLKVGYLGVDIFFVISGFLITGLLAENLEQDIPLKRFYLRRALKIVPQYLLAVFAGIVFTALMGPKELFTFPSVISPLIFYQNYIPAVPILGHTWVVAVEAHFYLYYPLVIIGVCAAQKSAASRRALLTKGLILLIIAGNALRYFFFRHPGYQLVQMTHVRFDALLFGGLLKMSEPYLYGAAHNRRWVSALSFVAGTALFIYVLKGFNRYVWFWYTLIYISSGILIVSALTGFRPLNDVLQNPFLRWVGQNSYGIYLWHYILLYALVGEPAECRRIEIIAAYIVCSLMLGMLTTVTIERYFLNIRNKFVP
ncbi:MAG: acyltransferase [Candidatus Omnitrophica bacterium]|nr:acyltransferase [Candidatus Omnitrophota bacterium]